VFSGVKREGETPAGPRGPIFSAPFVLGGFPEESHHPTLLQWRRRISCPPIPIDLIQVYAAAADLPLILPMISRASFLSKVVELVIGRARKPFGRRRRECFGLDRSRQTRVQPHSPSLRDDAHPAVMAGLRVMGWTDGPSALHHREAWMMTVRAWFAGLAGLTGAFWHRSAV
jgi:hypothetical protein